MSSSQQLHHNDDKQPQVAHVPSSGIDKFFYDNEIVKMFAYATVIWGIVGMLAGILAAFQLVFPALNMGMAATTFGYAWPRINGPQLAI